MGHESTCKVTESRISTHKRQRRTNGLDDDAEGIHGSVEYLQTSNSLDILSLLNLEGEPKGDNSVKAADGPSLGVSPVNYQLPEDVHKATDISVLRFSPVNCQLQKDTMETKSPAVSFSTPPLETSDSPVIRSGSTRRRLLVVPVRRNVKPNMLMSSGQELRPDGEVLGTCDSMGDEENVLLLSDIDWEPLFNSEKHETVSSNSSDAHFSSPTSDANQLRQLKIKQSKTDIQVQQLTERVKVLELQLIPSTASVKCVETRSADTMEMEEFPGDSKVVYFFGAYEGDAWRTTAECYSPLRDTKKPLRPMNISRSYVAAAALCGDIYVFGGRDYFSWFNTVESYNPQRNEWTACPSLTHKKGWLSGVTLGSKIYALGGGDGVNCFSDVEMFDPAAGRWIRTQSMLQKRLSSAAAELNGAIYAAGGYDGGSYLNSVERFDPREVVSWSSIPSMRVRRGCHSLVAMDEKLYALGGYNGNNMVSSVEEFDPRSNSWISGDNMTEARGYSTAAVIGESIFVISGMKDGKILTETVECYKEGQGWSVPNLKGAGKRMCFSSIVM